MIRWQAVTPGSAYPVVSFNDNNVNREIATMSRITCFFLLLFVTHGIHAETLVVTADRMFDAATGTISGPARVLVTDGFIASVNPDEIPVEATLIELGDRTLMPGLLDMHTHLTGNYFTGDHWVTMGVYETAPDWAILGTKFARDTLEAGFTTVRDAGALPGFPDVALMKAIARGGGACPENGYCLRG